MKNQITPISFELLIAEDYNYVNKVTFSDNSIKLLTDEETQELMKPYLKEVQFF